MDKHKLVITLELGKRAEGRVTWKAVRAALDRYLPDQDHLPVTTLHQGITLNGIVGTIEVTPIADPNIVALAKTMYETPEPGDDKSLVWPPSHPEDYARWINYAEVAYKYCFPES